jgi:hypothetical protein
MSARVHRFAVAFAVLAWAAAAPVSAQADAPTEIHGSGEAYAASGLKLAWAVLRGADEASTRVVLRIVADPAVYPAVGVVARNPFNGQALTLLKSAATSAPMTVRVPRSRYGDFPRTEVRLYNSDAAAERDTPVSIVFYVGVPDTTPEFSDEAALEAYLAGRTAGSTASGARTP